MTDLQKRIWLDLLVTPGSLLLMVFGVSFLMLSAILGSGCGVLGLALCLGSLGLSATNFLFNYESSIDKAVQHLKQEQKKKRNDSLDELDARLSSDRDPRDQESLRNLRGIYDSFLEDAEAGKISATSDGPIVRRIDDIFNQCVKQLERQHELWKSSRKVSGAVKQEMLRQKSAILDEVEKSVQMLADTVNEVRGLGLKAEQSQLGILQERLRNQLAAAKATEEIVRQSNGSDLSRFDEYEKQSGQ